MISSYKFDEIAYNITAKRTPCESDMEHYIGLEHLETGNLYVSNYGSKVPIKGDKLIMKTGDILLGKRNAYLRRAAIAPHDGLFSAHGMILRPKIDVIDEDFFPFFIASDYFFDEIIRISVGGLSPTINWKDLKELQFNLPSLEEQKALANKLWAAYSLKESYKRLIKATDEMVKSQFIEMFGSNDCESKPLSDLTSLITKGTTPTSVGFNFEEDGIKYIKAENICEDTSINLNDCMHISQDCHNTLKRSQLQNGDILFSIAGVIGRVGVITKECLPANTNQALAIIRFDTSKEINKEYAKHALLSPFVESQWKMKMRGAAQMNISLKDVGDINIPLPSLAKQEQFCQIAEQADKSKFTSLKSQFIEMFGDPMTNSKEWPEYGKINQYAQVILGTTPNSKEASYWDGDIKWITPAEMTDESYYIYDTERHITEEGVKSASLTLLPYRSVLFSTRAPIGKVGLAGSPMYSNQGFKNFICGEKLNPVYLYYSLIYKRDYLISLGTGTTFKELSKKTVEGLNMAVPPLHLQDQFESIYDQADKSKLELLQRMESINYIN